MSMRTLISLLAIALLGAFGAGVANAQATDVIRGRVTGPDSLPMQGVSVRATSYAGNVVKSTTTDKSGRFTIIFINGEGDYWIDMTRIAFAPKRFEVRKIGDEEVILAN